MNNLQVSNQHGGQLRELETAAVSLRDNLQPKPVTKDKGGRLGGQIAERFVQFLSIPRRL